MNSRRGSALAFVLIITAVLAVLGTAILGLSLAETNHATRSQKQVQIQYIARSGVEVGYEKLIAAAPSLANPNFDTLLSNANALPNLVNQILGTGNYSIQYEKYPVTNPQFIKIRSASASSGSPVVSDQVTLLVAISTGFQSWFPAPDAWVRAMNLWGDVNPSNPGEDMLGKGIQFIGTPSKSPQSGTPSLFRASVIKFTGMNGDGDTFWLQPQTNDVTFDAEVMLFGGRILMRHDDGNLILKISDETVSNNTCPPWTSAIPAGFENRDRYIEYCQLIPNPGAYYDSHLAGEFSPHSPTKFGLVHFEGDVIDDSHHANVLIHSGWYYYPNNVNLNSSNPEADLIEIHSNDPIIEATNRHNSGNYEILSGKIEYGNK